MTQKTLGKYSVKKQKRDTYLIDMLARIQRSRTNSRKFKLYWTCKDLPVRYMFESSAQRERFIEQITYLQKGDRSSETICIWCGTWNMGSAPPPALFAHLGNQNDSRRQPGAEPPGNRILDCAMVPLPLKDFSCAVSQGINK